jgi:hypothetical protein
MPTGAAIVGATAALTEIQRRRALALFTLLEKRHRCTPR